MERLMKTSPRETRTTSRETRTTSRGPGMNLHQESAILNEEDVLDLLEPQHYPDVRSIKYSLEGLVKHDETLKDNLISNKATLRAIAPYLQIFHKDQKKKIESAKQNRKGKEMKGISLAKKSKEQNINVVVDLSQDPELISSVVETGNKLKHLIKAEGICIYLVNNKESELYRVPTKDEKKEQKATFKIERGATMAGYVAHVKEYIISDNVLFDPRFPRGLGVSNLIVKFGLGIPIKTPDDDVVAVYEFTRSVLLAPFCEKEVLTVLAVTGWMGTALFQRAVYANVLKQYDLMQCLQQLSSHYHCSLVNMENVCSDIVNFARETINAEHCSFYFVIKVCKDYFVVEEYIQETEESKKILKRNSTRIVQDDGCYLYKVLREKETLNIHGNELVENNSAERSILYTPIVCSDTQIIGAIKLTNKCYEENFSKDDEQNMITFATFVSIHFHLKKDTDNAKNAEIQGSAIRDMLMYHIKPCTHDQGVVLKNKKLKLPDNFFTFSWYPSPDNMPQLAEITISMFRETLGDQFMLRNNVPKFILTVKNCYRPNPYHNFLHAFAVTHAMANIIRRYRSVFNGLERVGLMVAALCHDVDHRGYTNNFVQMTKHHLCSLYTSSLLEHHHFAVAKMIFKNCSMFSHFRPEIYDKLLTGIYNYIIATDLSLYFQYRIELMRLADENIFDFKDPRHRNLVLSLIMTTCDLSGQTKPMAINRKITEDVYEEFFQQGDIEKKMGITPLPTMDRDKKSMICENQVQFLTIAVIPCIETVSRIFTLLKPMLQDTKELLRQWKEIVEAKERKTI